MWKSDNKYWDTLDITFGTFEVQTEEIFFFIIEYIIKDRYFIMKIIN